MVTRDRSFSRHSIVRALLAVSLLYLAGLCVGQTKREPSPNQEQRLMAFLQKYLGDRGQEAETRYSSVLVDLMDDGAKEAIVYVSGPGWCGSGGCVMLILAPEDASYRVITKTTITRLPIRVLETKSNGWHDISVVVAGGGIRSAHEAILSFDGKTFPINPTVPPARPSDGKAQGKIVISVAAEGRPLYQ